MWIGDRHRIQLRSSDLEVCCETLRRMLPATDDPATGMMQDDPVPSLGDVLDSVVRGPA